jgi:Thiolase, N-terminal domain
MRDAVIVDAVRTPIGKGKAAGSLAPVHPAELLAHSLRALADRTGIDPTLIDDVIGGCADQVGEQAANTTRWAVLAAGFPETVRPPPWTASAGPPSPAADERRARPRAGPRPDSTRALGRRGRRRPGHDAHRHHPGHRQGPRQSRAVHRRHRPVRTARRPSNDGTSSTGWCPTRTCARRPWLGPSSWPRAYFGARGDQATGPVRSRPRSPADGPVPPRRRACWKAVTCSTPPICC